MQRLGKRITAALAASVLAIGLTACGDSGDEGTDTGASGGAPSGAIDFWMGDPIGDAQQPIMKQLAADYQSAHPGTTVNLRFLGKDAHQTYLTSIAGGSVPCVALIGNTWTPEFAALGALQKQSDDPESLKKTYVGSMVDSTVYEGASYGVPYDEGVRALIYRKDLFDAQGLSAPKTWDELVSSATKVQQANPGVNGYGVAGGAIWYFLPSIWQWGGDIATEQGGKWTAKVDSPQAVAAFQYYADLLTKHKLAPAGAASWSGTDAAKSIALGQTAMMVGGSWDLKAILKQTPDMEQKLATAPIPNGPGGNNATFAGGSNLAVFDGCGNKNLAKSFVDYMLQRENLVKVTQSIGLLPATLDGLEAEQTSGSFSTPLLKAYALQVPTSRSIPPIATWGKVEGTGAVVNAMQAIMSGSKSAEAAMKQLASEINSAIG
jgi:N,N'-diacetylchitobiose transport system substrate-binding protein